MADTATLSAKFQISIPKAVCDARKWKAGQEFAFISKGTGVLLVPVSERKDLAGVANGVKAKGYRDRHDRF
jgi:AbrB family looped-hinge helix DNA binding protein